MSDVKNCMFLNIVVFLEPAKIGGVTSLTARKNFNLSVFSQIDSTAT